MKRTGGLTIVTASVAALCLGGCGNKQHAEPPKSGDALRTHLLDILKARHEATLAGDLTRARSYNLPYANAENKVLYDLIGKAWDAAPTAKALEIARTSPVLFSGAAPVELKQSGDWAYLRQVDGQRAYQAYFLLKDGRWWVVKAYFSAAKPATDDRFAYLRAETYWPDHIADYFLLPRVTLAIAPSATPLEHPFFNKQLSLHVTNTSDTPISARAMMRRFRSVQFVVGTSQSAVEPSGGETFSEVKPGERFFVGNVQIHVPEDKKSQVVFYVGPYVSNRLSTP